MIELEEKGGLKLDNNGVFEVQKRFPGVTKNNNRWIARIRHPKLKFEVSLGSYGTPEEAALVVNKKKAEFEDMFKDENSANVKTCRVDFEGRKLPRGVTRRGYGRWGAQILHPKSKRYVRLGSYSSPEEAAFVVEKKKAEFLNVYGGRLKAKSDCHDNQCCLEKPRCDTLDKLSGDQEEPSDVMKLKSSTWGADIRDPKSRNRIRLGDFDTIKDAAKSLNKSEAELATKRKSVEFNGLELRQKTTAGFEANESPTKIERADKLNISSVPDKLDSKFVQCSHTWVFEAKDANSADVSDTSMIKKGNEQKSGRVCDIEKATSLGFINEYRQLMHVCSEFEEKDDLKLDNNGVFKVWKRFRGVTKNKNRWIARIRHPKLKFEVSLGSYGTPEEAALVVKKKKAEFEEMFKDDNSMNVKKRRVDFEGRKLPRGVTRRGYGRWGAQILHPKSKRFVRLGSYSTPEEAAFVVDKKRAEFLNIYGGRPKVIHGCKRSKNNHCSFDKPRLDTSDELSGDQLEPYGVTELISGERNANTRDPISRDRIIGTFDTAKEAVKSLNKAEVELVAEGERAEFDVLELRHKTGADFKANESPTTFECADKLNIPCVTDKLDCKFVQRSPTWVIEAKNSNSADVGGTGVVRKAYERKGGRASDFEEAMSMEIINEYGQLIGEYSKLDEQMGFSLPEDCDGV